MERELLAREHHRERNILAQEHGVKNAPHRDATREQNSTYIDSQIENRLLHRLVTGGSIGYKR
jgi:hypothetical protein